MPNIIKQRRFKEDEVTEVNKLQIIIPYRPNEQHKCSCMLPTFHILSSNYYTCVAYISSKWLPVLIIPC